MEPLKPSQQEYVKLVTGVQGRVRGLCYVLMPGRESDVDDVVQQINQVMLEKASEFQLGTNFQAWAMSIARF